MFVSRFSLLAGALLLSPAAFAQTAPADAAATRSKIDQTLRYYLDGGTNRDQAMVTKAFWPNAQMLSVRDGVLTPVPIATYLGGIKPGPAVERSTRIVSVDVSGNAAQARVESEYPTFRFIDYMTLLEVNGEWKIVTKTFYRQPK